ncbi:hypothetical protein [Bradyrhizobium pachyrhizi]|uniref:hypothetical protein n=1 Tax=Bradyrhizobium pachyrhizi TaxID=280333 RepID=UPI003D36E322
MPLACNDNVPARERTPEEHRRIVAEQATTGERAYSGGAWPQGRRLFKAGKTRHLFGLVSWQARNAMPRLSAANDNTAVNFEHTETTFRDAVSADEIMAAVEAEKKEPGKHYREDTQEVFVVTKRDDSGKPVDGEWRGIAETTGTDRKHSAPSPAWALDDEEDVEDKIARIIDAKRLRERLGKPVCTILDLAAGDATTAEITDRIIGVSRKKAEFYVDRCVEKFLQVAA